MTETTRRPDELILDELTSQLDRTRKLLMGSPDEAAEQALARVSDQAEVESRLAAELAIAAPLAEPDRFLEAHRLAVRALEVLDREGSRDPRLPRLGPLTGVAGSAVEYVAWYIVRSFVASVVWRLRTLYARREAQCRPEAAERRLLGRARIDMDRLAPTYATGGGIQTLLVGGVAVSAFGWLAQFVGAVNFGDRRVQWLTLGVLFVLFFAMSWVMLRGAAVAHRRAQLVMQRPLAALWETIGHAGAPPQDAGRMYATVAIVLTALVWFVIPAVAAVLFFL